MTIKDLEIINLNVYKHKGILTLEIVTRRPGMCIGRRGDFIDSYREFIKEHLSLDEFQIHITEAKCLFN